MNSRVSFQGVRVGVVGVVAGALLLSWPWNPVATAGVRTPSAAVGNTYGGVTSQGMPVIVVMTSTRRQVVRAVAAVVLNCTSGGTAAVPDKYPRLPVSKKGKFRTSFGPVTQRNDDGTTTDFSGRITGALNHSRTQITGVWHFLAVDHDATGAMTDSCDSGLLDWTAKQ